MSKKNRQASQNQNKNSGIEAAHAEEYGIIRHDLIRVVILNSIYLIAVLALYFTNQKSQYLEHWFGRILHF